VTKTLLMMIALAAVAACDDESSQPKDPMDGPCLELFLDARWHNGCPRSDHRLLPVKEKLFFRCECIRNNEDTAKP